MIRPIYDIPEPSLEPPEPRYIGWCEYCYADIYEDAEWEHLDCEEEYWREYEQDEI